MMVVYILSVLCITDMSTFYTYVPLSLRCIIWYWHKGGDALQMGR